MRKYYNAALLSTYPFALTMNHTKQDVEIVPEIT